MKVKCETERNERMEIEKRSEREAKERGVKEGERRVKEELMKLNETMKKWSLENEREGFESEIKQLKVKCEREEESRKKVEENEKRSWKDP